MNGYQKGHPAQQNAPFLLCAGLLIGLPIMILVLPLPVFDLGQASLKANLVALLGWVIILMPHEISGIVSIAVILAAVSCAY